MATTSIALTGCPVAADLEQPERFDAYKNAGPKTGGVDGLSCDITQVMTRACFSVGCHGTELPAAMLDLQSPGVESRLVNVPASHANILDSSATMCQAGELRVDSANPENSVILKKLEGRQSCGATMPTAPRSVTPAEIQCFREWVYKLAGVPLNGGAGGAGGSSGAGGMAAAGAGGAAGSSGTGGATAGAAGMAGAGTGGGGTGGGGTGGGGTGGGGTGGA